ncbi:translation initiation factor eIF-2B subunit delta [Halarchaeum grantii]|uniref:Translation initiation factor eIF-2B subunit delta n=1 Tax=Halarchaeum grantii TaxID=1193105 RepID=A0A830EXJ2_9EURY|nr:translation initiation factor eIF-2B [Halarchaeum grantii]GGL39263.1 translation initiation factor eIF-2B subunit delta [Halarchaeum grantii]
MIDEAVQDIEEMRSQSASVVAVKAARALEELVHRDHYTVEEGLRSLERNSNALRRASPSHTLLHTTQKRILERVTEPEPTDVEEMTARLRTTIRDVVADVQTSKERAAAEAARTLSDGDTVLTHESSSTVIATLEHALEDGLTLDLYVTEARPRFLGRRTARRLADHDAIDVTVVVDGAAGYCLDECDRVLVGMNCFVDDVVYNRVGTFPIVTAADYHDVPVTVVGSSMKFIGSDFVFENTLRSPAEVLREPADGFSALNPSYDETPIELLDTVVTEDGAMQL